MAHIQHAAISCLAAAATIAVAMAPSAPALADDRAPSSLRMRRVAQRAPDPAPADPKAPAGAAKEDGKTEVISVIDSSIEHTLFTGRAPVSVVSRADLVASGRATLGDILQSIPAQSNAGNAQTNAGGDGTTRINLRGLGAPRTLVLINGRRVVPGGNGADAAVDVNAIPLAMIERVEVMKDGASALYGADAVGGVVNLITRPQFDGVDFSLLTSTSQHGDGTEYDGSVVTGFTTKDKRTYLVVSAGYQQHGSVLAGDRAFSTFQNSYDYASRTAVRNASLAAPGGRLDVSSIRGGGGPTGMRPPGCGSDLCRPDGNGAWTDFTAPGDLYNDAAGNYLYTPSTRYNLFATAGNRVNDNFSLVIELLMLHRDSSRQLSPVAFVADSPISKDSMYNPLGGDIFDYRRRITELGSRQYIDSVNTVRLVVGAVGSVPKTAPVFKDWNFEVSYDYGSSESFVKTTGQLLRDHVADALGPSMKDASGTPICVATPGDPSTKIQYVIHYTSGDVVIPCVPLDILAPRGTIPTEQLMNLTYVDAANGLDTQGTFLATAGGQLVELPYHGEIAMSLGGNYRRELGRQFPAQVAGVGFGYTTDNVAKDSEGRFRSYEGFAEMSIVPITGHDIAQRVEIDLGARGLRHSRYGASLTYKAGALFRTVGGIALRGTYATAFRAPTVPDLFGGRTERNPAAEDPCDTRPPSVGDRTKTLDPAVQTQCSAQGVPADAAFTTNQQLSVVGGNQSLRPESAATATIGVVVEPPQLKGLAITADYWRIGIDDAIETLGVGTIFANCYDRGLQDYCDQIHRDPKTHRISPVDQLLQNVPRTVTSGIDLVVWYDTRLAELGRIHSGLEAQYLLRYDLDTRSQVIHGVGFYDLGVYPHWKANLSGHWAHPSGGFGGLSLRFVGGYQECAGNNCNSDRNLATAHDVDRYYKLDLFAGYDLRSSLGRSSLQLGVNNLFDATPPVVYNAAAANSDAATYDFVGRMIYLRLSQMF